MYVFVLPSSASPSNLEFGRQAPGSLWTFLSNDLEVRGDRRWLSESAAARLVTDHRARIPAVGVFVVVNSSIVVNVNSVDVVIDAIVEL